MFQLRRGGRQMRKSHKRACGFFGLIVIFVLSAAAQEQSAAPVPAPQGDQIQSAGESASGQPAGTVSSPAAAKPENKAPVPPSTADQAYELKLRGLEERVNELKEKIFRTKARILQLQETVVSGSIGLGARAMLIHRNEMGGAFKLLSVQYTLDTAPIFSKVDVDGDLDKMDEKEIYAGNIVPGNHNIAVQMIFQGQGYGFFSYMKGYKITVTSSYFFTAEEGKIVIVKVVGFERGGITISPQERPAIRYDIQIQKLTPERAKSLQEKAQDSENPAEPGKTPESAKTQEPG
jgi:hypothetical protein